MNGYRNVRTDKGLPKSVRLLNKVEFQAVFAHACTVADNKLVVFAGPNGCDFARLGLAISRKCSKRAVDRNRIKRAVREAFRGIRTELPARDFVVVGRVGAVKTGGLKLQDVLRQHLKKICQRSCGNSS